jgi:hypothetical protein
MAVRHHLLRVRRSGRDQPPRAADGKTTQRKPRWQVEVSIG